MAQSVDERQLNDAECSLARSLSAAILVVLLSESTGETLEGDEPWEVTDENLNTGDLYTGEAAAAAASSDPVRSTDDA